MSGEVEIIMDKELQEIKEVYNKLNFIIKSTVEEGPETVYNKLFREVEGKLYRCRSERNATVIDGDVDGYTITRTILFDSIISDLMSLAEDLTMAYWRKKMNKDTYNTIELIRAIQSA